MSEVENAEVSTPAFGREILEGFVAHQKTMNVWASIAAGVLITVLWTFRVPGIPLWPVTTVLLILPIALWWNWSVTADRVRRGRYGETKFEVAELMKYIQSTQRR